MNGWHHFSQSLSKHLKTKKQMSSAIINTRPTKRSKTHNIPHLPDSVFRNIMSYVIDPLYADRKRHKELMAMNLFKITILPLFQPLTEERVEYYERFVLQETVCDMLEHEGYDYGQFDIRTQSTLDTKISLEAIGSLEEELGGIVYNDIRGTLSYPY